MIEKMIKLSRLTVSVVAPFATLALMWIAPIHSAGSEAPSYAELFDEIHKVVEDDFFDPNLRGVDWDSIGSRFRSRAIKVASREEFARVVNEMLRTLGTSHTRYLTADDPKYYQLLGVFESSSAYEEDLERVRRKLPQRKIGYVGIGIETLPAKQGRFVAAVFDGGPADKAGIVVGDRLVSVNGKDFHAVKSFLGLEGKEMEVLLQRTAAESPRAVKLTPRFLVGTDMFVDAMKESARVVEVGDCRIGYIHAWSYSGQQYQDLLVDALFGGKLDGVDALLFDVRDGWGGASPDFLQLFDRRIPELVMKRRGQPPLSLDNHWRKPVALLINQGVRSGKEAFAWGFKRLEIGPVIGETTAGAVTAGSLRFLADQSVLYLAVGDITVDGQRLEGRGVAPTVTVTRPIPYCRGRDPQFEEGIRRLKESVAARRGQ